MTAKPRNEAILNAVTGGRVVHVGCVGRDQHNGDAEFLHGLLADAVDDLVGVDIDADGVESLAAEYDVRVDDAERLATITAPVETVVATEVIEHLSNPGQLFAAARDVLAPRGELLITTPNPWALCYLRRAAIGQPVGNDDHTCWFDRETLAGLARRQGYRGGVEYLPPMSEGLTAAAWRLGHERLGGTRLFGRFTPREVDA